MARRDTPRVSPRAGEGTPGEGARRRKLTEDEVMVSVPRFHQGPALLGPPEGREPTPIPWPEGRRLRVEVPRRKKKNDW